LGQAVLAFKIWHGVDAPYETMKKSILGVFWWYKLKLRYTEQFQ
jgi:hypothetical protein